ncbi:MAG: hypothetical protein Q8N05_11590 [Bacteroidota bacterium]|nr:hypothetical protein [Bacteroidota bacterium]
MNIGGKMRDHTKLRAFELADEVAVLTIQLDRLKAFRQLVKRSEKNFLRRFTIFGLLKIVAVIGFHFSKYLTVYSPQPNSLLPNSLIV